MPFWNGQLLWRECKLVVMMPGLSERLSPRVCCVAGAGRGPLVERCLKAIERSQRVAFVYAVEKNPNAFVTWVYAFGPHPSLNRAE